MPKRKNPKVIGLKELEKKGTRELIGYLKRLQKCEDSFELSDMPINLDISDESTIYFKQSKKWKLAYTNVKTILKNREHLEK